MRLLIITLSLIVSSLSLNAQSFTVATSNGVAKESFALTIEGKSFEAYSSRTGSVYIIRTSKEGKEYKSYLGHRSDKNVTIDGQSYPVWSSKPYDKWDVANDVEFYAYKLGKTGFPSKVKLEKN